MKLPQVNPFAELNYLGLAIRKVSEQQYHVGILYRNDASVVKLCHLAWHHDLRFSAPSVEYLWTNLENFDEETRRVLAAFIQVIEEEHPAIPYGFKIDGDCFDNDDKFVRPPLGMGLTCATFVVAVLRHQGIDILDETSWPVRTSDVGWQSYIVDALKQNGASQEHIDALAAELGGTRIRPNEVVAAALTDPMPNDYASIEELAGQILQEISLYAPV